MQHTWPGIQNVEICLNRVGIHFGLINASHVSGGVRRQDILYSYSKGSLAHFDVCARVVCGGAYARAACKLVRDVPAGSLSLRFLSSALVSAAADPRNLL